MCQLPLAKLGSDPKSRANLALRQEGRAAATNDNLWLLGTQTESYTPSLGLISVVACSAHAAMGKSQHEVQPLAATAANTLGGEPS